MKQIAFAAFEVVYIIVSLCNAFMYRLLLVMLYNGGRVVWSDSDFDTRTTICLIILFIPSCYVKA